MKAVVAELIGRTRLDYTGLWEVFHEARRILGAENTALAPARIRSLTLQLASAMLDDPAVKAGHFRRLGGGEWVFERWGLPKKAAMSKISDDWSLLGQDPGLGDIVWFVSDNQQPRSPE